VTLAHDDEGRPAFTTAIIEDVTDVRTHEEDLRFRALHDPLTGLANRALLMDRLESALARSLRSGARVGVAFMDLDGFKDVNDRLGHGAGDEVLCAVADRLQAATRQGDSIARFGGDEFVVLFEETGSAEVLRRAVERLRTAIVAPIETRAGAVVLVDASIGAVLSEDSHDDPDDLLRGADAAMYDEKRVRGRRRGTEPVYSPGSEAVGSEPVPSDW
jgi:diguanylate cyclase (GGDEF)-like protein